MSRPTSDAGVDCELADTAHDAWLAEKETDLFLRAAAGNSIK
jgi:hypothetical protein